MPPRRPNRRDVAAAATRAEILAAARRLFIRQGFAATTLQQIAGEAGVAVQTVYDRVGPKSALLLALNDLIDSEADVAELAAKVAAERDPARMIAGAVHLTRQLNERCGDLIGVLLSAEASDPAVAAVVAEGAARHRAGMAGLCSGLAAAGALADGLDAERATTIVAFMTAPRTWRELAEVAGWTFDESEAWLTAALVRLVVAEGRARDGRAARR